MKLLIQDPSPANVLSYLTSEVPTPEKHADLMAELGATIRLIEGASANLHAQCIAEAESLINRLLVLLIQLGVNERDATLHQISYRLAYISVRLAWTALDGWLLVHGFTVDEEAEPFHSLHSGAIH